MLEIASGTGQHIAHFAAGLPGLHWQPTDREPGDFAAITARRDSAGLGNIAHPVLLDVLETPWRVASDFDAVLCINMIHITPWAASKGLMTGAERTLRTGGVLYLYGPCQINGRHTAQSNQEFDAWLRTQNAEWGVRDIAEVTKLAQRHRFSLAETVSMPANNLSVIFERGP